MIKHGTRPWVYRPGRSAGRLTGNHHAQDESSKNLGFEIVSFMRQKIDRYCQDYDLNYTLLATPQKVGGSLRRY